MARTTIAVIGAGPVGLEAALHATLAGHDVHVYETGDPGHNVQSWGHIRLFTPFGMNASTDGLRVLQESGWKRPSADALLTGRELTEAYLFPLFEWLGRRVALHTDTRVLSVSRPHFWKGAAIGQPERARDGFELLVRPAGDDEGHEQYSHCDAVFDCSGTYPNHNWVGAGGSPAPGERSALDAEDYLLTDVCGAAANRFADRCTLLVGSGYSAATAITQFDALRQSAPRTRVCWITHRRGDTPLTPIPGDPLASRAQLVATANRLATGSRDSTNGRCGSWLSWRPGWTIRAVHRSPDGFHIRIEDRDANKDELDVDTVLAHVGYRPDRSLYEELQIHECYASQGPMKLAASLLQSASQDCLQQSGQGAATLRNPEPNFFILGSKSYGRDSRFLLRNGLQQVQDACRLIADGV